MPRERHFDHAQNDIAIISTVTLVLLANLNFGMHGDAVTSNLNRDVRSELITIAI